MRYLICGLFAFVGLMFLWPPATAAQCPNCPSGKCSVVPTTASVLSDDGVVLFSSDGKTYARSPDGVYRAVKPAGGCVCCAYGCKCAPPAIIERRCECYPCRCNTVVVGGKAYYIP